MLYIGVLRIKKEDNIDLLMKSLPEKTAERLSARRNEKERRLSAGAYSLLSKLYKKALGTDDEMPQILYTGEGKPYFEEEKDNKGLQNEVKFSISHDEEVAVVALSLHDGEVGVDVQSEPKRRINLEKIAERFFSPFRNTKEVVEREKIEKGDISISFYKIENGQICDAEETGFSISDTPSEFLMRWTLLEASLKASSYGFSKVEDRDAIVNRMRTRSFALALFDREYAVSVAIMKQKDLEGRK